MKVVIFAGGIGTRISEESHLKPKPMIEIGEHPILWHIMKIYEAQGFHDFIICLGYKSHVIKDYFMNYHYYNSDLTMDLASGKMEMHRRNRENMKVTLVETGLNTMTGGRLKRVESYLDDGEDFLLTYGDGVADVDLNKLLAYHHSHGKMATVTAVQPAGRFGAMGVGPEGGITRFQEKPAGDGDWVNGGFFVFKKDVFDFMPRNADDQMLETHLLTHLSHSGQMMAYRHYGFWKCMDALRDKVELENLWHSGKPPWKIWD